MLTEFHIGLDDTDSVHGGCTTYTAAILFQELLRREFVPADFPWLVRLNPNIPWKTRGNGALSLHFLLDQKQAAMARKIAFETVERTSDPTIPSTDPALAFLEGKVPSQLVAFSRRALHEVIRIEEAGRLSRKFGAETHVFKGSRGLVGALAALGADMRDHTFEIIAYRKSENLGTPRKVDPESIRKMDDKFQGKTFNNIDPETGRILICPHGHDPVLFGIRGEDATSVLEAFSEVRVQEPVEMIMIFKSNQGTDAHLFHMRNISELRPHHSTIVTGRVSAPPVVLRGGHVIFKLEDETGSVDCAAYEPTGPFRKIVRRLRPGDHLKVCGGVRFGPAGRLTLNLEKMEILGLVEELVRVRPRCSDCGGGCESMGRDQGFRCRRCGVRYAKDSVKAVSMERLLRTGLYLPPARAHRHLTKPLARYRIQAPHPAESVGDFGKLLPSRKMFPLQVPVLKTS